MAAASIVAVDYHNSEQNIEILFCKYLVDSWELRRGLVF